MMCALGQVDNDFPVWSLNAWSQIQSFPVPEFQTVIYQVQEKFHIRQPVFSDAVKDLELCHQWVLREMLLRLDRRKFNADVNQENLVDGLERQGVILIVSNAPHLYSKELLGNGGFLEITTPTEPQSTIGLESRERQFYSVLKSNKVLTQTMSLEMDGLLSLLLKRQ